MEITNQIPISFNVVLIKRVCTEYFIPAERCSLWFVQTFNFTVIFRLSLQCPSNVYFTWFSFSTRFKRSSAVYNRAMGKSWQTAQSSHLVSHTGVTLGHFSALLDCREGGGWWRCLSLTSFSSFIKWDTLKPARLCRGVRRRVFKRQRTASVYLLPQEVARLSCSTVPLLLSVPSDARWPSDGRGAGCGSCLLNAVLLYSKQPFQLGTFLLATPCMLK